MDGHIQVNDHDQPSQCTPGNPTRLICVPHFQIRRRDSTIVAPYEKWEYYDPRIKQMEQDRNYALNKTKRVAWFVSNCGARNGRLQFAHELQKYIQVSALTISCSFCAFFRNDGKFILIVLEICFSEM